MPLHLYNTFAKGEQEFVPLVPGRVTMYTCGPTVYGRPHVGNYASFLLADVLRRWLEAGHGYAVTHVKNITDVGHLVADADTGEDKVERQARHVARERRGGRGEDVQITPEDVLAIARKYEEMYLADERTLRMIEPEHRPRATTYIEQMKAMIDTLLASKHAYATEDGIYFDVHAQTPTPYGTLSGNTLDALESGARVAVDEKKKHPADFALWKFCVGSNTHHALRWPSPGTGHPDGFPGWHIECSAMSGALLGEQIDVHTGGEDNIFPHHECELAQSESASGKKPFVGLWLHKRRIQLGEEKMSKSLGNILTIPDIIDAGFSPMDLRYYLLSVHYRTNLKFTDKGLADAHKARRKIMEWMEHVSAHAERARSPQLSAHAERASGPRLSSDVEVFAQRFAAAMNADLNTPEALAVIFEAMAWSRGTASLTSLASLASLTSLIRHTFGCFDPEQADIPADILALAEERKNARARKDFARSDELRDALKEKGFEVRDVGGEQEVRRL